MTRISLGHLSNVCPVRGKQNTGNFKGCIDDDETHKRTSSEVQYFMREKQLPVIEIGSSFKEDGEKNLRQVTSHNRTLSQVRYFFGTKIKE